MCCILSLFLLIGPRVAFIAAWLFTDLVTRAFEGSVIVPLLGVIFVPFTSLLYVLVWQPVVGLEGVLPWALVGVGLLMDISSYTGGFMNRDRARSFMR
jgi:hypothetical protein